MNECFLLARDVTGYEFSNQLTSNIPTFSKSNYMANMGVSRNIIIIIILYLLKLVTSKSMTDTSFPANANMRTPLVMQYYNHVFLKTNHGFT